MQPALQKKLRSRLIVLVKNSMVKLSSANMLRIVSAGLLCLHWNSNLFAQPDTNSDTAINISLDTLYQAPISTIKHNKSKESVLGDTGSLLGDSEEPDLWVENTFKTSKVINLQSTEFIDAGVLDIKINHRFGAFSNGRRELFGLDNAYTRIGAEYGILPGWMIGSGRSGATKTYDLYTKKSLIRQKTKSKKISVLYFGSISYNNSQSAFLEENRLRRLAFVNQLIVGRKFNERLSILISPSVIHHNSAPQLTDNTLFALGLGSRVKLTNRTSLNLEWIPLIGEKGEVKNSFSIGFDIETGGHVFQLHFTNSADNYESGFMARTADSWLDQGFRFGFNIARVFTLVDPIKFEKYRKE